MVAKGHIPLLLAAAGGSVFAGNGATHIVHLSAKTGRPMWKVRAEGFEVPSLTAENLLVANAAWTKGCGVSIEAGSMLYTLSASCLWLWRNRWLLMGDEGLVLASPATGQTVEVRASLPVAPSDAGFPRIDGQVMLYQAKDRTEVVAYDLSRQELLWKRPLRREIAERLGCDVQMVTLRPMEDRNVFLAHVQSRVVVGCSLADGSILWDMAVPFDSPVVPHRDRVYVMLAQEGRESSPRLVCLDAATGARVYDVLQRGLNVMDFASYGTVYEDYIGFGTRGGLIGLFRLADGGLAWSYRYKVPLYAPAMADERLYVCADDGNLLVFEPA